MDANKIRVLFNNQPKDLVIPLQQEWDFYGQQQAIEQYESTIIEKILKKKQVKKINYYLIKWKNYKIKDATWEKEDKLIEDGLQKMIDDFNNV